MTRFRYRAIAADGRVVRGILDAAGPADLEARLQRQALDLVGAEAVTARPRGGLRRAPRRELIAFCFHLEHLMRAGIPIVEALTDLRDSIAAARFRTVVAALVDAIESGQTLSAAIASHDDVFGRVFASLVHAGEASGRLPEILERLGESLKWEDEWAAQARQAVAYPACTGVVVLAVTAFLMLHVVPPVQRFVLGMGQALPAQTRALFFVSDLVAAAWPGLVALPPLAALTLPWALRRHPTVRLHYDGAKLRLPLLGPLLHKLIVARFTATFAQLYSAGIPVLEAIRITRGGVGNHAVEHGLQRVEVLIAAGSNIAAACTAVGLFPPLVARMLSIGERTGDLDRALRNVAYFYTRDVREAAGRLQAMLEPALVVVLGALLGWVMLAVLAPVYDVVGTIRP